MYLKIHLTAGTCVGPGLDMYYATHLTTKARSWRVVVAAQLREPTTLAYGKDKVLS